MNLKEIREMINLMNENDLMEMEVEREGSKIKLTKASSGVVHQVVSQPAQQVVAAQPAAPAAGKPEAEVSSTAQEIVSPMVGTFYRSPSPEAPSYVEIGQTVEVGQVVCIVEAMKLMNEIKSEIRGKVVAIPVENAHPVEFGQTLFSIEPV